MLQIFRNPVMELDLIESRLKSAKMIASPSGQYLYTSEHVTLHRFTQWKASVSDLFFMNDFSFIMKSNQRKPYKVAALLTGLLTNLNSKVKHFLFCFNLTKIARRNPFKIIIFLHKVTPIFTALNVDLRALTIDDKSGVWGNRMGTSLWWLLILGSRKSRNVCTRTRFDLYRTALLSEGSRTYYAAAPPPRQSFTLSAILSLGCDLLSYFYTSGKNHLGHFFSL